MKHQSSTSTARPISLSSGVERRIEDPEVRRVLLLFIELGQTDVIECLNNTVKQAPNVFQKTLDAVCFYVKRGLRTQRYLTKQMSTGTDPSDWPYDRDEEDSFSSEETQLVDKCDFGTRWPTVSGAIDMIRRDFVHCVEKYTWKSPTTRLTYHSWSTVTICPNGHLWDGNSVLYESAHLWRGLRSQFVIFYPGLVNFAFLEQEHVDELEGNEIRLHKRWEDEPRFHKKIMDVTCRVIESYGSIHDSYINFNGLFTNEKLAQRRRIMLAEFEAQRNTILKTEGIHFGESSFVVDWQYCEKFWRPGDSIGSILHSNRMMTGHKFREECNFLGSCMVLGAVRNFGVGSVVPRAHERKHKTLLKISSKFTGEKKGNGGKHVNKHLGEANLDPPTQSSRDRGSSLTRAGNQRHESNSKKAEAKAPAKKSSSGSRKPATDERKIIQHTYLKPYNV